jgi:D-glycero-D-manno-heptose 1,7-bisphosphate phosphatase
MTPETITLRKALFLDRDGVINKEVGYLHKTEDLEYIPGIFELCIEFQKLDYLLLVITNQSGIARKYFSESEFQTITKKIHADFLSKGIAIARTYHCPHHPEITGKCQCRKPKPGMILQAKDEFNLDLKNSLLVGDSLRDVEAGNAAGVGQTFLLSRKARKSLDFVQIRSLNEILDCNPPS